MHKRPYALKLACLLVLSIAPPVQAQTCDQTTPVDWVLIRLVGGSGIAGSSVLNAVLEGPDSVVAQRHADDEWWVQLPSRRAPDGIRLARIGNESYRQVGPTTTFGVTGAAPPDFVDEGDCYGLVNALQDVAVSMEVRVEGDGEIAPPPTVETVFVPIPVPTLDSVTVSDTAFAGHLVDQVLWWLEQTQEIGDTVGVAYIAERLSPAANFAEPDLRVGLQGGFLAIRTGGKTFSGATLALVLRHRRKWHFTLMGGGRPAGSGDVQPDLGRSQTLLAGNVAYYPTDSFWGFSAGLASAWESLRDFDAWVERAYGVTVGPRLRTLEKWHLVLGLDFQISTHNRFLGARDPSTGRAAGTETTFPSFGFTPSLALAVSF